MGAHQKLNRSHVHRIVAESRKTCAGILDSCLPHHFAVRRSKTMSRIAKRQFWKDVRLRQLKTESTISWRIKEKGQDPHVSKRPERICFSKGRIGPLGFVANY